jgi:multidrug efflux pump subunit AcrA (membrane-fusion protein)
MRHTSRWLTGVLLVIVLIGCGAIYLSLRPHHTSVKTVSETVTATNSVVKATVTGSGVLMASQEYTPTFTGSGTLTSIRVHTGEKVTKGQILATINASSAKGTFLSDRATFNADQLAYSRAKSETLDDILASDTTSSSASSSDTAASDSDKSDAVDISYSPTTTTTVTSISTSSPTKTTSNSGSNNARTNDTTASNTSNNTSTSSSIVLTTKTATASELAQARSTRRQAIEQAQASLYIARVNYVNAKKALDDTTLRASAPGTVVAVNDSVGDTISSSSSTTSETSSATGATGSASSTSGGDTNTSTSSTSVSGVVEIDNLSHMDLVVDASESEISSLKVGQSATVTVTATGKSYAAKVASVSWQATDDDDVVSYPVTLRMKKAVSGLRPGMSASASIVTKQATGISVPSDAITGSGVNASVLLVEGDRSLTTSVTTGLVGASMTLITSGLQAGDKVEIVRTIDTTATTTSGGSGRSFGGGFGGASGGSFAGGAGFGGGAAGGLSGR